MKIQFLYSPLCSESEVPSVYALAEKFPGSFVENYSIFQIEEGQEKDFPGDMPSIIRALRRGEGFLTTGMVFVEGKLMGSIAGESEELVAKIKAWREKFGENSSPTE